MSFDTPLTWDEHLCSVLLVQSGSEQDQDVLHLLRHCNFKASVPETLKCQSCAPQDQAKNLNIKITIFANFFLRKIERFFV